MSLNVIQLPASFMSACRLLRSIWPGPCCCRHFSQPGLIFFGCLPIFFPRKEPSLPSYFLSSSSSPRMITDPTSPSSDTAQIHCRGAGPRNASPAGAIASGERVSSVSFVDIVTCVSRVSFATDLSLPWIPSYSRVQSQGNRKRKLGRSQRRP